MLIDLEDRSAEASDAVLALALGHDRLPQGIEGADVPEALRGLASDRDCVVIRRPDRAANKVAVNGLARADRQRVDVRGGREAQRRASAGHDDILQIVLAGIGHHDSDEVWRAQRQDYCP